MTSWSHQLHRGPGFEDVVRWAGASLAVLAAYAGGIAWALSEPRIPPAEQSSAPAIMVEFAPVPEVVSARRTEVSPDMTDSNEVESDVVEPVDKPVPTLEPHKPEPLEEVETADATQVEPTELEPVAPRDNVEVPLPVSRAEVIEPEEKPKKKVEKKRETPPPAAPQTRKGGAQSREGDRNAARQSTRGRSTAQSSARWQSRLLAHLERYKRYPGSARSRGATGTATVRFSIDGSGRLLSARIARSSGSSALDGAALSMVRRASPMPAPPTRARATLTVPVRFIVR